MIELERSGIYQIRNIVTGNRYIGSAKCFRVRWNGHRARLVKGTHHSRHLQNAWDRYGAESFVFEVLEICEPDRLLVREQSWLDLEEPEYNVCRNAGNTLGRSHSDETKKKIAEKASGRKRGPRSEEHRAKLSAVHSGKKKPEHVMRALQEGRSRQAFSNERRAKVSAALTAAYQSGARSREKTEAHREKIGAAFAKLSDSDVIAIRQLRKSGVTGRELARRYGSNPGTISEICSGKRYRWVA